MTTALQRWPAPAVKARRAAMSVVNLSSNELHHPAADALVARLVADFTPATLVQYPVQTDALETLADLYGRAPENLLLFPGSDAAIRLILTMTREHMSGTLVLQEPNYETWTDAAGAALWRFIRTPSLDGTAMGSIAAVRAAAALAPPKSLVAVSWPNGPAGHLPPLSELEDLQVLCRRAGHVLVVDACYAGFAGDPREVAGLADDDTLVLLSWSKLFGLAGGRLGMSVGGTAITNFLRSARVEDHVNALMLHAARRTPLLYTEFEAAWRDIARRRENLRTWLGAAGVPIPPSGGNFLHVPMPDAAMAERLTLGLAEDGYRVRNMGGVTGLANHVRFTVACGRTGETFAGSLAERLVVSGIGRAEILLRGPDLET